MENYKRKNLFVEALGITQSQMFENFNTMRKVYKRVEYVTYEVDH